MLWVLGTVAVGAILAWRGVVIANTDWDYSLHSTAYVIGRFHYDMSLLAPFPAFAAAYAAMRYTFRARYSEAFGQANFWTMFAGSLMILSPPLWLEREGAALSYSHPAAAFAFWSGVMSVGYLLTVMSLILFVVVVIGALRHRHTPADGAIET